MKKNAYYQLSKKVLMNHILQTLGTNHSSMITVDESEQ